MGSRTVDCRKFSPNIFNKSKCSHCFRQREEHSAAALECNRASRKVSKCGYLFVAPDWDFSNPLYRTKRWQRRWFVLYDDGELTYSVDEHPETIPQACIDMTKVIEVTTAEDVTGHTNSLAITAPDRVTFVKGTCSEEAKWWLNVLGAFPKTKGRHKRNATFPGGQATTIISTQVQTKTSRSRHNSYHPEIIQSPTTVTPLTVVNIDSWKIPPADENDKNVSNENSTSNSGNINSSNSSRVYIDQPISSKSPPTRDKLYPEGKAQTRIRNRNRNSNNISNSNNNNNNSNANGTQQQTQQLPPPTSQDSTDSGPCLLIEKVVHCDDKLKDIANTLTTYNQNRWNTTSSPIIVTTAPVITDIIIADEKPTRDVVIKSSQQQNRPQSLSINTQQSTAKSSAPSIVSAIVKKKSGTRTEITSQNSSSVNSNISNSNNNIKQQHNERGDPDGGCNLDDMPVNYLLNKNQELRVNIPSDEVILNSKKGWLMKQDSRGGEWTRHWFTLHGAALFYYRDPVAEERGVLDGVLDVNSLTGIQETQLQQNYGFQLMTWDNRRIILATVSSNIRNNWINVLKTAAGLTTKIETSNNSTDKNSSDQSNTTDDLKICEIEKNNSNSSSNSNNNSTVVVNTISNSNNTVKSPITPLTPKSILFSSDEEYRTASEGGRRDSVDWGSPISTSPPIPLTAITTTRTKDRLRSRSNSNSPRLYGHNVTQNNKRSRSSPPTSRRSTIDSVGSDEMIIIHPVEEEIGQIVDPEIELRLVSAEKELSLLKGEAQEQENRVTTLITTLEKTETDLTKRIKEAEKARDNLGKQLTENKNQAQDYIERLTLELEENHKIIRDLEDKLARGIEENEIMYKKLNNLENNNQPSSKSSSISSLNRIKMNKRMSSLSDLTSLSEFDPFTLERDFLAEEYNELKHRFEKAVHEIKLMKKELKEAQNQYDSLEIVHAALKQDLECRKVEDESQNNMMAARIQDLTSKYYTAERQVRSLKSKLAKSTEKRRSLSLKGRESLSLPKEFEEKVIELENKIDAIEGNSSKTEERVTLKKSSRLRRKSLDNSSISSEPIQVLLRLNTLEKRVDNHSNESINSSSTNIHQNQSSSQSPKMTDHLIDRLKSLEGIVIATRDRIEQSLSQLQNLKSHTSHRTRRSVSPITDKKDTLKFIEKCLSEAGKMLKDSCENCVISSAQDNIILLPETSPIKLALVQLEAQLRTKLNDLLKQRRVLRERNELYQSKDLELLAERIAFESVVFGKLRESIVRGDNNTCLEYGEKETRSEISETSQLLALLKLKLGGKCSIKPNGSIDILASVLARRLVLSARRIGKLKIPEITPVNSAILDELLRQQNELNVIVMRYKNNAIETLSSGLAAETLNYISSNDAIQGAVQEAWRQAQETVNSELIQSEISNIMLRHAERYENLIIPSFGYTLTHSERITFENFADSVQDTLRKEMDLVIMQLNKMYEEYLDKMKKGQWNIHLSQDHNVSEGRQLLCEFADIVAHKALIDARINILKGEYTPPHLQPAAAATESPSSSLSASPSSKDKLPSKDLLVNLSKLQKYENLFSELAENLEISNPDDILAEADFNFLYKYFCYDNLINKVDLNEISNSVIKLENSIINLEKLINNNNNNNSEINNNISGNDNETLTFKNIYVKNNKLIGRIDSITEEIKKSNLTNKLCPNCKKLEKSLVDTKTLYDNKIVELNQNFEANQAQLKLNVSDNNNKMKLLNDEKLQIINELSKKTQLIVKFEAEIKNLNSKINLYQIDINNKLTEITKLSTCRDDYTKLKMENKTLQENLDKEKERIKKLEKHLEYLENEHQIHIEQIQENFNGKFIINNNDNNNNHENSDDNDDDDDDDNLVSENNLRNEESLRKRYQKEIEQLRALCEKGLAAMESSHRRIIAELGEKHRNEIQELLSDKEQALAEETQATLAALDAMRKAHQNEVQREVTRFKQEFIKQFQLGGNTLADPKEKEHELEDVRLEILSLSEKYSSKCVEAASLEDKLKMATQQIKQSQHIIHQLEMRNKQLRAHLMSDDIDVSSVNSITAVKDTNPVNVHDERNLRKSNSVVLKQNQGRTKHEIQPRINLVEEVNFASVYTPVYNPSSLLTSLGSCESLNTLPQSSSEGFITPASAPTNTTTTTKIISPKSLTMKLRLNRNNNNNNNTLLNSINNNHNNNNNNNNNNNLENSYEGEYLKTNANKLLCSPPPLNGKDVEHLRNFELEI